MMLEGLVQHVLDVVFSLVRHDLLLDEGRSGRVTEDDGDSEGRAGEISP